jgi:RNA polymerase sigma-70 factor (ECF subfamily)
VTDEELVARAQAGSDDAWAELVQRHHRAVYRTAHVALLSREEADDAAQDAWVSAWRAIGEFRGQATFRTWVLTIAWRKAIDRRRGVVAWWRALRLDAAPDGDQPVQLELVAKERPADAQAISREERRRIQRLVRGLPRAHRDALLIAATGDIPYAEAAAVLGIPVGTLKWRVSEARRLLRERM